MKIKNKNELYFVFLFYENEKRIRALKFKAKIYQR